MQPRATRAPFRVLAGIVGVVLLLFGLPAALLQAQDGSLGAMFAAVCCVLGGFGMLTAASTGRWFNAPG